MRTRTTAIWFAAAGCAALLAGASLAEGEPTCSSQLGVAVHGQHIVGDYVTGVGHGALGWPPRGAGALMGPGGAAVPGGPGPGLHFPNGFAPGASFCTGSRSPGVHLP